MLGWYFAKKNGEDIYLNKNGKSKFRYETRSSSGEFCDALFTIGMDFKKDKLSDQIKDSKNFMPFWENDPTVKSMLVVIDKIHEKFKEFDFNDRLENLKFAFLDLESFKLDDDLYIKMNSRGKQLSDFENFKAEFIGFIKEKFGDERSFEIAKKF